MKAMILAAGLGKRLGKITGNIPKALLDINGKTALQLAVEKCSSSGFTDIIVNVHHFADLVEDEISRLNKKGFRIEVSDEREKLLDTGGGLFRVRDFFDDQPFLVYNVDIITDLDLKDMYNYHLGKKGLATLAVRHRAGKRFYLTDGSGLIRGWRNTVTGEQKFTSDVRDDLSEIAFSGIHIIDSEIFKYMTAGIYSMTGLYLKLARKYYIHTYLDDSGYWVDIGTPDSLGYIRSFLSKRE